MWKLWMQVQDGKDHLKEKVTNFPFKNCIFNLFVIFSASKALKKLLRSLKTWKTGLQSLGRTWLKSRQNFNAEKSWNPQNFNNQSNETANSKKWIE